MILHVPLFAVLRMHGDMNKRIGYLSISFDMYWMLFVMHGIEYLLSGNHQLTTEEESTSAAEQTAFLLSQTQYELGTIQITILVVLVGLGFKIKVPRKLALCKGFFDIVQHRNIVILLVMVPVKAKP
eukprot:12121731-Ditylum_brightwellii.AAC.1